MKTLSVVNQKGGCGKTTLSIALASYYQHLGKRTLLIDMDSQHNSTSHLLRPFYGNVVIKNVLDYSPDHVRLKTLEKYFAVADCSLRDCVQQSDSTIHLVPCTHYLKEVENWDIFQKLSLLREGLNAVSDLYDLVIIDTPPLIKNLVSIALFASDFYLVPLSSDIYSFEGFSHMQVNIGNIKNLMPVPVRFLGCLITRYKKSHDLAQLIRSTAQNYPEYRIFNHQFNFSSCYEKASLNGGTVYTQRSNTKALINLELLGDEVWARMENGQT